MILTVTLNPCIDHAVFVEGISLHDTNRVRRTETDAGGKGLNLSRVAVELGGESLATGFLGGGAGAYIRSVLKHQGVSFDFVKIRGETRVNFSVEDGTEDPPTTFNEPGPATSSEELEELVEKVRTLGQEANWICLCGSAPPSVPKDIYRRLGSMFPGKTLVDADGELLKLGLESSPRFLKPNSLEAGRLLGTEIKTLEDALQGARTLQGRLEKNAIVVISRGEQGAVMACEEGLFNGITPDIEPKSTIGSGDSMLGGMLWAIEARKPLEDALRWGLAAGAATATTNGSEIARKAKVVELYEISKVERISSTG